MKSKAIKRQEANTRQAEYDMLSIAEKLEKLDSKIGNGIGAKKQRAKLHGLGRRS